jgi:hypothetical protein
MIQQMHLASICEQVAGASSEQFADELEGGRQTTEFYVQPAKIDETSMSVQNL